MAISNKPVITAYQYRPSPLTPKTSQTPQVPDFAAFMQKNTGVKQDFAPKAKA